MDVEGQLFLSGDVHNEVEGRPGGDIGPLKEHRNIMYELNQH